MWLRTKKWHSRRSRVCHWCLIVVPWLVFIRSWEIQSCRFLAIIGLHSNYLVAIRGFEDVCNTCFPTFWFLILHWIRLISFVRTEFPVLLSGVKRRQTPYCKTVQTRTTRRKIKTPVNLIAVGTFIFHLSLPGIWMWYSYIPYYLDKNFQFQQFVSFANNC